MGALWVACGPRGGLGLSPGGHRPEEEANGPGAGVAGGCWARKQNRKVVGDKEKKLEEEYRGIMEGRMEMKILLLQTERKPPRQRQSKKSLLSCSKVSWTFGSVLGLRPLQSRRTCWEWFLACTDGQNVPKVCLAQCSLVGVESKGLVLKECGQRHL